MRLQNKSRERKEKKLTNEHPSIMVDDGSASDGSYGRGDDRHSSDGNSTSGRSHDESSTTGTSVAGSRGGKDIPDDIIAREESRAVALSRMLVLVVLVVSATAAGVATFILSKKAEMADFEVQVCMLCRFSSEGSRCHKDRS